MFKVGDKVVCVDNYSKDYIYLHNYLKLYKIYTITYVGENSVFVNVNEQDCDHLRPDRFVLLTDYRKQKINKICSNLEKK